MALQPSLSLHLRKLAANNVRTFAAAAASRPSQSSTYENPYLIPREELQVSKVNDVTVASVETNKPLAKVAVYIRAGSRFETDSTQGVTQMMRICAGLGTAHDSQFSTTRTLEQNGGILTCTTGREFVAYTVECGRNRIQNVDKYVKALACYSVFKPWEVKDNVPRLRLERKIRPPEVRIMELIHKAAYRKGLGYSLYSPKWMIGNHDSEMLNGFVKNNFVEASLVGVGVNHLQLKDFAEKMRLPGSGKERTIQAARYNPGSELRKETNAELAYVAMAIEGASFKDSKKMATAALVHRALGAGPRSKRGGNLGGKISTAVAGDVGLKASATTFSTNYGDSGLLGVFIAATPCSVESVVKKSAEVLLGGGFKDEDLARAKAQLKADIAFQTESDGGYLEEIGLQSLLTGHIASPQEVDAVIESITADDMNALARGKLTLASFGRIANVPYLDQLSK